MKCFHLCILVSRDGQGSWWWSILEICLPTDRRSSIPQKQFIIIIIIINTYVALVSLDIHVICPYLQISWTYAVQLVVLHGGVFFTDVGIKRCTASFLILKLELSLFWGFFCYFLVGPVAFNLPLLVYCRFFKYSLWQLPSWLAPGKKYIISKTAWFIITFLVTFVPRSWLKLSSMRFL